MAKRVLIIDDDSEFADILSDILEANDYTVFVASDGVQAIEKTKEEPVDLILMDIQMPVLSGFWFCDVFKKKAETKDIPIIMISGLSDKDNAKKARELGACAFLKKPFQAEELFSMIEKYAA